MVDYYIGRSHLGGSCAERGIPVIGNLSTSSVAYAASTSAKKLGEEIITSGAVLMKYQYINSTGAKSLASVIRVDLNNKYVKLDVMTGQGNQFTTRQSTGGMAKENGAVVAINGDFLIPARRGSDGCSSIERSVDVNAIGTERHVCF